MEITRQRLSSFMILVTVGVLNSPSLECPLISLISDTDFGSWPSLPGHVAGVTHPAMFPLVVAAAGLADVELAVQTLAPGVDQELEGLETSDAVALSQLGLVAQQLSLCVFFLNLCL